MGHCVDDPEARGILNLCPEDKLVGGFNMFQYVSIIFYFQNLFGMMIRVNIIHIQVETTHQKPFS